MRGGFVACLSGNGHLLGRVVDHMRWHHGKAVHEYRDGLEIAALVDAADGPAVQTGGARTILVHGSAPAPLTELQHHQTRFAAIEWDGKQLRASRDPIGLAPLFYRVFRDRPWFATEVQPLVALGSAPPDLEALAARAAFAPLDDRTGWEGIRRVLPGSTIEIGPDRQVSSVRYWKPAEALGRYRGGRVEALAEFRERFRVAVRRCYEPGGGILLSGGLDSAAIALTAVEQERARPYLVHIHFPGLSETDEQGYAGVVAAAVGAPLNVVPGHRDPWDVDAELDGWGGIAYNWLPYGMEDAALAHMAALGITVALDGHDGDGVLGPSGSNWGDLILKGEFGRVGALALRHGVGPLVRGVAVDFLPPYAWLRSLMGRATRPTYMQSVAQYFQGPLRDRIREADIDRWTWPSRRWRVRQVQPLLPRATISFEQKEIEAARHGIDLRHPFADRDLVEFLISLPSAVKSDPMRPKAVLIDSLSEILPTPLQQRPKSDYMAAVRQRVDPAACIERIRTSGIRLPGIDYGRLFDDAEVDPEGVRLFFLVNLTRVHAFAQRAHQGAGGSGGTVPRV